MSQQTPWILDASVLINLLATGDARGLLQCLSFRCLVESHAYNEVLRDPSGVIEGTLPLRYIIESGHLGLVNLESTREFDDFIAMAGACSPDDLGDGEAGGIAIARSRGYILATDDSKARRIATTFPAVALQTSVDLLKAAEMHAHAEPDIIAEWVDKALRVGRMRVLIADIPWIERRVKPDQLPQYPSLHRWAGVLDDGKGRNLKL